MKPPKIEPLTNIINIAILLWPSSSNPDIVNSVGIGITEDSKLFMNRPINPSFTNPYANKISSETFTGSSFVTILLSNSLCNVPSLILIFSRSTTG